MSKIIIPQNADELISLGQKVLKKHTEDGANSPLSNLDMAGMTLLHTTAKDEAANAASLRKASEKAVEKRDLALGIREGQNSHTPNTLLHQLSSVRDVLLGIYRGNERALGDWGFDVVQNSTPPKTTPPPANP